MVRQGSSGSGGLVDPSSYRMSVALENPDLVDLEFVGKCPNHLGAEERARRGIPIL